MDASRALRILSMRVFPLPPLAVWQLLKLFQHHSGPEFASLLLLPVAFTIQLSNHKTSAVSRYET